MTRLLCTAMLLSLSSLTMAAEDQTSAATFEDLDVDHDGVITKAEAIKRDDLAKHWDTIDTNKNGGINIDEFVAYESKGRFVPPDESDTPELGAAPME